MTPIQQLMLGAGGVAKKTYMDDVFNTYLYTGNSSSSQTFNNGVDLSGEGGMVWIKNRGSTYGHQMFDTVRGVNKRLRVDLGNAEDTQANTVTAFNSNGFTVGTSGEVSDNNTKHASWSFRKAPGFFDVVTYTGNGSNRTIAHSLGSIPGFYMIKRLDTGSNWLTFHRDYLTGNHYMVLNDPDAMVSESDVAQNTRPTSSVFSVGTDSKVNADGGTYVCYLFAGGESTAATARSVEFDGNGDYLSIADHADFDVGTNWTAECWFKCDGFASLGYNGIMGQWPGTSSGNAWVLEYVGTDLRFYLGDNSFKSLGAAPLGQWHHVAISKEGSTTRIFLNGTQVVADYDMGTYAKDGAFTIGGSIAGGGWFDGKISNVRIVQGTAVYTSSFKPPTEPLTNITNTKLLCCNNSSLSGSTVTPGTITVGGNPTASTDSPFDDPAAFVF